MASARALEQDLFERLIAVSGIGPKLALAVLSGIEPADLVRAIRTQDVARLTKIPGIGKKTAERIGLELKDRLPLAATQPAEPAATAARPEDQLRDDLLSALTNLGYQSAGGGEDDRQDHRRGTRTPSSSRRCGRRCGS